MTFNTQTCFTGNNIKPNCAIKDHRRNIASLDTIYNYSSQYRNTAKRRIKHLRKNNFQAKTDRNI